MSRKRDLWLIMSISMFALTSCQSQSGSEKETRGADNWHEASSQMRDESQKAALANVELGLGYLAQGQVARAKAKLNHALELGPELPETHTGMAHFLERVSEFKEAEKEYQTALKLGKRSGAVSNNYGAFLCRQSRYQEADLAFQGALKDKSYIHTAEVYENAGVCALRMPDPGKAEGYLEAAIKHDPTRTNALLELTALSLSQNKTAAAAHYLNLYKAVEEPKARSLWLEIQLARKMNDAASLDKSATLLKTLFQDSPEFKLYQKSSINKT